MVKKKKKNGISSSILCHVALVIKLFDYIQDATVWECCSKLNQVHKVTDARKESPHWPLGKGSDRHKHLHTSRNMNIDDHRSLYSQITNIISSSSSSDVGHSALFSHVLDALKSPCVCHLSVVFNYCYYSV